METLLLLCYAALCIVIFKVFRIPLNKWTVPTAVLGGVILIGMLILGMNYNFPYSEVGKQVYRTVPIVSQTRGRVTSVPVKPNQMLHEGDILFTIDPTPFQAKVDDLTAQVKASRQVMIKGPFPIRWSIPVARTGKPRRRRLTPPGQRSHRRVTISIRWCTARTPKSLRCWRSCARRNLSSITRWCARRLTAMSVSSVCVLGPCPPRWG